MPRARQWRLVSAIVAAFLGVVIAHEVWLRLSIWQMGRLVVVAEEWAWRTATWPNRPRPDSDAAQLFGCWVGDSGSAEYAWGSLRNGRASSVLAVFSGSSPGNSAWVSARAPAVADFGIVLCTLWGACGVWEWRRQRIRFGGRPLLVARGLRIAVGLMIPRLLIVAIAMPPLSALVWYALYDRTQRARSFTEGLAPTLLERTLLVFLILWPALRDLLRAGVEWFLRRSSRSRCFSCNYPATASAVGEDPRCPECGVTRATPALGRLAVVVVHRAAQSALIIIACWCLLNLLIHYGLSGALWYVGRWVKLSPISERS